MSKDGDAQPPPEENQPAAVKKKNKKKQSDKPKDEGTSSATAIASAPDAAISADLAAELAKKIQLLQATPSAAKDISEAKQHNYQFWGTQPVPKLDEKVTENTALMAPGWFKDWHCGVRTTASSRLVAFISAVPANIRIYDKQLRMVEVNFLCVHKKLRSKRVAPVLIREVTRRVNLKGVFQATFTAGVVIPKPVGACRYWHRSLNPKKLIETNFSHIARNMTLQRTLKLYKLPDEPQLPQLVKLETRHLPQAFTLLNKYLEKYDLAPTFTQEEFEHFFLPRDNVIYSYVIENDAGVTDLISFYSLPSSVMHNPKYTHIRAAYSFYNVAASVSLSQLMNDALILAKKENFDVFNALDLMENKTILEELKFGIGDGNLQYYLYNWRCPDLQPEQIGLVLQ
ncbi:glycylpeptide N-tetradecanoyltransferase 1 [Ditylenchus destructor]|uniref:Glycylpeptide N-tetradecanoyltransferase n=1 Tax=Ditylenchus destructor TaxID=166010 RepID=A0AAD4N165_9BILA|nr:glycylpeptide N-tetradecanoyltransferase 1 [Ditylenchus destructor]